MIYVFAVLVVVLIDILITYRLIKYKNEDYKKYRKENLGLIISGTAVLVITKIPSLYLFILLGINALLFITVLTRFQNNHERRTD
ncbi:tellurite resistance protein TehA-like permease [Paenibacillus phyllosphaerae]|uniref:Tellurite resistance protein TehA-like permease n=1 Tax=Paenibacillus phyllosphaerae TaxID=274593 RepID=A0A7W5B2X2_9BACL|nr:tellurite resistance protein TehA-like permease [Paenibacillus phyllosphaerae]